MSCEVFPDRPLKPKKPGRWAIKDIVAQNDDLFVDNSEELLYLPYWLPNAEEMQAMFIDRSEFSAHNQVMAFQNAVVEQKKATLAILGKHDVLAAFTLDSPIPFSINQVLEILKDLNEELIEGARGLKQGHFFWQFSRLLTRLRSKISDKRYGTSVRDHGQNSGKTDGLPYFLIMSDLGEKA